MPGHIPEEYKDHYHLTAENFIKAMQGEEVEYTRSGEKGRKNFIVSIIDGRKTNIEDYIIFEDVYVGNEIVVSLSDTEYPYPIYLEGKSYIKSIGILKKGVFPLSKIDSDVKVQSFFTEKEVRLGKIDIWGQISDLLLMGDGSGLFLYGKSKVESITVNGNLEALFLGPDTEVQALSIWGNSTIQKANLGGRLNRFNVYGSISIVSISSNVNNVSISRNSIINDFKVFGYASVQNLTIENYAKVEALFIFSGRWGNVNIGDFAEVNLRIAGLSLTSISVTISSSKRVSLKTYNTSLCYLYISSKGSSDDSLELIDTQIHQLKIDQFKNKGEFSLQNVKALNLDSLDQEERKNLGDSKSQIFISQSNLGSMHCMNVDFNSFDKLVISESDVVDIRTRNSHLPLKGIHTADPDTATPEEHSDHNQLSELYNQLYLAMQKQGNRTQEMEYYSAYLDHRRLAAIEASKYKEDGKTPEPSKWKRFWKYADIKSTLWLGKVSNNYNRSWLRPLLLLLSSGLVFYALFMWFYPWCDLPFVHPDSFEFWPMLGNYGQFLLPTHRLNFIDPTTNPSGGSMIIDVLSRIVIGYLIYQMIAAFRRYGRK